MLVITQSIADECSGRQACGEIRVEANDVNVISPGLLFCFMPL